MVVNAHLERVEATKTTAAQPEPLRKHILCISLNPARTHTVFSLACRMAANSLLIFDTLQSFLNIPVQPGSASFSTHVLCANASVVCFEANWASRRLLASRSYRQTNGQVRWTLRKDAVCMRSSQEMKGTMSSVAKESDEFLRRDKPMNTLNNAVRAACPCAIRLPLRPPAIQAVCWCQIEQKLLQWTRFEVFCCDVTVSGRKSFSSWFAATLSLYSNESKRKNYSLIDFLNCYWRL